MSILERHSCITLDNTIEPAPEHIETTPGVIYSNAVKATAKYDRESIANLDEEAFVVLKRLKKTCNSKTKKEIRRILRLIFIKKWFSRNFGASSLFPYFSVVRDIKFYNKPVFSVNRN